METFLHCPKPCMHATKKRRYVVVTINHLDPPATHNCQLNSWPRGNGYLSNLVGTPVIPPPPPTGPNNWLVHYYSRSNDTQIIARVNSWEKIVGQIKGKNSPDPLGADSLPSSCAFKTTKYISAAFKFLVGSCRHVFSSIFLLNCYIVKNVKF